MPSQPPKPRTATVLTRRHLQTGLTVSIAMVVGVLGVFDVVDPSTVAAATLATLALLAFDLAEERRDLAHVVPLLTRVVRALHRLPGELPGEPRLAASTSGLNIDLAGAADVRLVGVTLGRTLRNIAEPLARRLAEGALVRIAVIDPATSAPAEAARRATLPDDRGIFTNRLRPTLDLVREVAESARGTGRIEVRLLPFVPSFGLIMVDAEGEAGRLYVDVYSHRPAGAEPVLALTQAGSPQWYRHYLREFDHIWAHGQPIDLLPAEPAPCPV
ncbi:DUF5919 domain-containing protein [Verrucosispora sp. WMMD703]|uniref:DUF5919 domain-containing protein n=1 Tax=Micromonospora sediminimaris TaxID=547162 RepID=A0A9W5UX86_9ACTN|nr:MULTISPECIES: DUF5919 domain-containing protein [Micromonospora]WFE44643.1 DUF5919 domain-containing protein [Verrucosispora sp. WMMD1129]GIJ36609.1 hypothetical protein Vse01_57570 [Micromonospora sediminimaris]SFC02897.1 hypothetical protein SAMN05216284_102261 [Micromonospora sediminimaris]